MADDSSSESEPGTFSVEALPVPGEGAKDAEKLDFVENQLLLIYAAGKTILSGLRLLGNADTQQMRGGQSIVQMARQGDHGHEYAIKFFVRKEAFEEERRIYCDRANGIGRHAASLMLPQVRNIDDNSGAGAIKDTCGVPLPPYIVMERGESLDRWSIRNRPDMWQSVTTITHIADRLEALHAAGYVHRDLKPSNVIWLPRRNRWTVIDFGCVVEAGTSCRAAFSLPYAAPETLRAHTQKLPADASVAVDAWSLGVMFFELLTGRQWYKLIEDRKLVNSCILGKAKCKLPWEEVPLQKGIRQQLGVFRKVVLQLMDRNPDNRPSMQDFCAACERVFAQTQSFASSDSGLLQTKHRQLTPSTPLQPTFNGASTGDTASATDRAPDPSAAQDVGTLMATLSSMPAGLSCDLDGRTLDPPTACSREGGALWAVPGWPQAETVSTCSVEKGLFSLKTTVELETSSMLASKKAAEACAPCNSGGRGGGEEVEEDAAAGAAADATAEPLQPVITSLLGGDKAICNGSLCMTPHTAISLDTSCRAVSFSNVTFKGGVVACSGAQCTVSFKDCTFQSCQLVVLTGAHATLDACTFTQRPLPEGSLTGGVSIYAWGVGTLVRMNGGSITGGLQGASGKWGARIEAHNVTISRVEVAGVAVRDEGSTLQLTDCVIHKFSRRYRPLGVVRGLHVHNSAAAELLSCTVGGSSMCCAVDVASGGSSEVTAERCDFIGNATIGALAVDGGTLVATDCNSCRNTGAGFGAEGRPCRSSLLQLSNCSSSDDLMGCLAIDHGNLTARNVRVTKSQGSGFHVGGGGDALLVECGAVRCSLHGVCAQDGNSRLHCERCHLQHNAHCGIVADLEAVAVVKACASLQNGAGGYVAFDRAKMTVSGGSSEGDVHGGCDVWGGGELTMEGLMVDGLWSNGTLPQAHPRSRFRMPEGKAACAPARTGR